MGGQPEVPRSHSAAASIHRRSFPFYRGKPGIRLPRLVLLLSALCGASTLGLGVALLLVLPQSAELSEGFRTPVIAFEFAKAQADLTFLAGSGPVATLHRESMAAAHAWDTAFPFAYAGLLAATLLQLTRAAQPLVWAGVACSALIVPFDLYENQTLLQLLAALERSAPVEPLLAQLSYATWLKWGAIGASALLLAASLAASRHYALAVLGLVAALGVAAGWASGAEPRAVEALSALVTLWLLILAIRACWQGFVLVRMGWGGG